MYSPSSPVLSSLERHSSLAAGYANNPRHQLQLGLGGYQLAGAGDEPGPCLKFKYFTTFLVSTACLALLSGSLATHKWLLSRPVRVVRLPGSNMSSLAFLEQPGAPSRQLPSALLASLDAGEPPAGPFRPAQPQNSKFQGEIYFGLFQGVKVLNHGFGARVSHISVIQSLLGRDNQQESLVDFKLWLATLTGVLLAILFALISSIFAIINFVMTPRAKVSGPIGLVVWNAVACFSCLLAIVSWLVEYFVRLQTNVLTLEEVQNGWTSENRSHFGYSYYFVSLAFVLHLVNIFIISIVHFQTWTSGSSGGSGDGSLNGSNKMASKRQSRPVCEGVIMLY